MYYASCSCWPKILLQFTFTIRTGVFRRLRVRFILARQDPAVCVIVSRKLVFAIHAETLLGFVSKSNVTPTDRTSSFSRCVFHMYIYTIEWKCNKITRIVKSYIIHVITSTAISCTYEKRDRVHNSMLLHYFCYPKKLRGRRNGTAGVDE